jgi:hypothetical protein
MTTSRTRPFRTATIALLATLAVSGVASADPPSEGDNAPQGEVSGARSAESGVFLPYGLPAQSDAQRAYVWLMGGYDAARGGVVFDSTVQATLVGPLSVRGGAGYAGPDGQVRPSVSLAVQALRQSAHGVDLSVYGGFQSQGFNTVPAVQAVVALGRRFGRLGLITNVGYGYGLEEGEHYGEFRLAGQVRVLPSLQIGLDARGRIDLERDADEPENEPDFEVVAGPLATWSIGRFSLSAGGGVATIKFRRSENVLVGAQGQLLVGMAF